MPPIGNEIRSAIENFELTAALAEKQLYDPDDLQAEVQILYEQLIDILENIIEELAITTTAKDFLNENGVDRIVLPNLSINYSPLRKQLLLLLKVLIENNSLDAKEAIKTKFADKLVHIYETDSNIIHKAYVFDILEYLLPNNPKLQFRLITKYGLDVFYNQINKIYSETIFKMLNLFNELILEHMTIVNNTNLIIDMKDLKLYKKMGFLEKISTQESCNGLLTVFDILWTSSKDHKEVLTTIEELLKNIKNLCLLRYRGQIKAIKLFDNILKYVKKNKKEFDGNVKTIIEEYANYVKLESKDEF